MHADHAPQAHDASHRRSRVPQFPQGSVSFVPGVQVPICVPHAVHVPLTHTPPPGQGVPGQHAWPGPPHSTHLLLLHRKPVWHASERQHGWSLPPQGLHLPESQSRMPWHWGEPLQHGPSSKPQLLPAVPPLDAPPAALPAAPPTGQAPVSGPASPACPPAPESELGDSVPAHALTAVTENAATTASRAKREPTAQMSHG